jgi:RsmE family RNA methyltransferase
MKHVPHIVVPAPWEGNRISLSIVQWRHLTKVMRLKRGVEITYTDGLGTLGHGLLGSQEVERGEESQIERPSSLTLSVAPPANKDRQRFVVEKLAELGVARLQWLRTEHGSNRVANPAKVFSWVHTAVEQSRGAWLMETSSDLVPVDSLPSETVFCHPGGGEKPENAEFVAIGPEGGFTDDELPVGTPTWDLGPTILRVETAAIVAATRLLGD